MRLVPVLIAGLVCVNLGAFARFDRVTGQQPTFRASTRLIQVSVVVRDNRNRPVEGLTKEDFQIFEEGREQPVSLMHVRRTDTEPARVAAERGVFTNRIHNTASGGVIALVYDRLNTSWSDQVQARDHLLTFLGRLHPEDRVALYVLDAAGVQVLHDFTRDASALIAALSGSPAAGSIQPSGSEARQPPAPEAASGGAAASPGMAEGSGNAIRESLMRTRAGDDRIRSDVTLDALELIAAHLQGVPGRKNVVWVSSGFPFYIYEPGHKSNKSVETRRATRILNNSDVAVYPVDARGIIAARGSKVPSLRAVQEPFEGARFVAEWTGGRPFYNTNDLGTAISQAAEDSRLTYILGYYPADVAADGRFRSIKVKVRRPGVGVRHRSGYFALPEGRPDAAAKQKALLAAIESPLEATALPVTVRALSGGPGGQVSLLIELEAGALTLEKGDAAWRGSVDVAIAQMLPGRQHLRDTDVTIPIVMADDKAGAQGVRLTKTISLKDSAHQLRIVVRDALTGETGSVIIDARALRRAVHDGS